jgi:hypothetical protein
MAEICSRSTRSTRYVNNCDDDRYASASAHRETNLAPMNFISGCNALQEGENNMRDIAHRSEINLADKRQTRDSDSDLSRGIRSASEDGYIDFHFDGNERFSIACVRSRANEDKRSHLLTNHRSPRSPVSFSISRLYLSISRQIRHRICIGLRNSSVKKSLQVTVTDEG